MIQRYGVHWSDGTYTGGITDHYAWASDYLRLSGFAGRVYASGSADDPELQPQVRHGPANIWRAP